LEAVSIAKAILGRNLTANDDPRDYCPRLDWRTSEDGRVDAGKFIGFGRNATSVTCQKLDPLGNKHTCTIVKGAKFSKFPTLGINSKVGTNFKSLFESYCTVFRADTYWTLTDQKTYIVIVICAGDGKKFFNVISTKPVLEKDVKDKISAHVEQLGFNPKNFNTVDFSLCY